MIINNRATDFINVLNNFGINYIVLQKDYSSSYLTDLNDKNNQILSIKFAKDL